MMDMRSIAIIPLVVLMLVSAQNCALVQSKGTQMMADETREAQETAKQFARRLNETNNLAPIVDELFVRDFLERFEHEPNGFPLASFSQGVASQVSREERLRYYTLVINSYYLSQVYLSSKVDLTPNGSNAEVTEEELYPPEIINLLKANPSLAALTGGGDGDARIKSVEQLRSILPTLEKVVVMMRGYLAKQPIKQSALYKKNLAYLGSRDDMMKPWVSICDKPCYGFSSGARLVSINVPFLQLRLVRDSGKLKILSVAPYSK